MGAKGEGMASLLGTLGQVALRHKCWLELRSSSSMRCRPTAAVSTGLPRGSRQSRERDLPRAFFGAPGDRRPTSFFSDPCTFWLYTRFRDFSFNRRSIVLQAAVLHHGGVATTITMIGSTSILGSQPKADQLNTHSHRLVFH